MYIFCILLASQDWRVYFILVSFELFFEKCTILITTSTLGLGADDTRKNADDTRTTSQRHVTREFLMKFFSRSFEFLSRSFSRFSRPWISMFLLKVVFKVFKVEWSPWYLYRRFPEWSVQVGARSGLMPIFKRKMRIRCAFSALI